MGDEVSILWSPGIDAKKYVIYMLFSSTQHPTQKEITFIFNGLEISTDFLYFTSSFSRLFEGRRDTVPLTHTPPVIGE